MEGDSDLEHSFGFKCYYKILNYLRLVQKFNYLQTILFFLLN